MSWEAWINKFSGDAITARPEYYSSDRGVYRIIQNDGTVFEMPGTAFESLYRRAAKADECAPGCLLADEIRMVRQDGMLDEAIPLESHAGKWVRIRVSEVKWNERHKTAFNNE